MEFHLKSGDEKTITRDTCFWKDCSEFLGALLRGCSLVFPRVPQKQPWAICSPANHSKQAWEFLLARFASLLVKDHFLTPCWGRLAVRQIRLSTGNTWQLGMLPTVPESLPRPLLARLWGAENAIWGACSILEQIYLIFSECPFPDIMNSTDCLWNNPFFAGLLDCMIVHVLL